MPDYMIVTGMVLEATPVNDYDRRTVILTKETGKITAFCRGARRQNSRLLAATNPFAFGKFKVYEGRSAYNLIDADISYYFEELRADPDGAFLGMYFLEYASFYTYENNDETMMLKLLFQSVRAITRENIDNRLIRAVYEIKTVQINGEYPGLPGDRTFKPATVRAVDHIVTSDIEHLYTFAVSEEVLNELSFLGDLYRKRVVDRPFKSLQMLENNMLKL
ncbi:MAG: DNA repair protein RecO [Lachnospiraceae bacterium]|nr:DNA repair protein RecO [Lachnospiraceae bacterium]